MLFCHFLSGIQAHIITILAFSSPFPFLSVAEALSERSSLQEELIYWSIILQQETQQLLDALGIKSLSEHHFEHLLKKCGYFCMKIGKN